jgi:hypothetical protein
LLKNWISYWQKFNIGLEKDVCSWFNVQTCLQCKVCILYFSVFLHKRMMWCNVQSKMWNLFQVRFSLLPLERRQHLLQYNTITFLRRWWKSCWQSAVIVWYTAVLYSQQISCWVGNRKSVGKCFWKVSLFLTICKQTS